MKKLALWITGLAITACCAVTPGPLGNGDVKIKSISPHVLKPADNLSIIGTDLNDITGVTIGAKTVRVVSNTSEKLVVEMPQLKQGAFDVVVTRGTSQDKFSSVFVLEGEGSKPPIAGPYTHANNPGYFPGEVMISLPANLSKTSLEAALQQSGSRLRIKTFVPPVLEGSPGMCGKSLVVLEIPDNKNTAAVLEEFRRLHPDLDGLNWWGDPHTADLGDQGDQAVDDPSPLDSDDGWGWQVSKVPSGLVLKNLELNPQLAKIKVAVLDTGVSAHQEFRIDGANKSIAFAEGRDFSSEFPLLTDNYARRDQLSGQGHGTGVAAIIGALNYNSSFIGIGIDGIAAKGLKGSYDGSMVGVSPGVKIVPVKVCQKQANDSRLAYPPLCEGIKVAAGICHAIAKKVNLINLSLGGPQSSPIIHAILKEAADANISIVAASGNTGKLEPHFPAAYSSTFSGSFERIPGLIAVGAVGIFSSSLPTVHLTKYSTQGSWVDVVAPGGDGPDVGLDIYTATSKFDGIPDANSYDFLHGTSFAAPFVTGTAALLLAQNPSLTPEAIKAKIKLSGLVMPEGCTSSICGAGLLDVSKSLGLTATGRP
jgi:subtilisin family serine protease